MQSGWYIGVVAKHAGRGARALHAQKNGEVVHILKLPLQRSMCTALN